MIEILLGVGVFTGFVLILAVFILSARSKLVASGNVTITINDSVIRIGTFITTLISFAIIGATLFVVVKAYEKMKSLRSAEEKAEDPTELDVLTEIRDLLKQRAH